MNFLLDTTVLIDAIRSRRPAIAWVAAQDTGRLHISTVTVGELFQGLHHAHAADPLRLASAIDRLRHDTLQPFAGRIVSFDTAAAEIWGRLMGEGAARGRVPPTDDAKIAAIALRHGMTVATSNTKDFAPLCPVLDPRTAA